MIWDEFKEDSRGTCYGFEIDSMRGFLLWLCAAPQTNSQIEPTQEQGTHLQSNLDECNKLLVSSPRFD